MYILYLLRKGTMKKSAAEKTTLKRTIPRSTRYAVLSSSYTKQNISKVLRSWNCNDMKDNLNQGQQKAKPFAVCYYDKNSVQNS